MGQVRHDSATTTHAVRAAIQRSQASLAQLSQELCINPKTGRQMAEAGDGRGSQDRTDGAALDCPDRSRGGDGRGVPTPYAADVGRLSLRSATFGPAPDPLCAALMLAATWNLA